MTGTEHHCDTCTCAPPVPDLNAECEANARDWYGTHIFGDVGSADLAAVRSTMQAKGKDIDNLSARRFREALTTRADILRRTADELTDRDRRAVMPTYIIKPSRDEDFYVWWSTVVDAPIGWGPRDYVPLDNEGSPERFARADERGTSANWPDWPIEKMPFGWNVSEWRITNQDDLEETGEGWWLLPRKNLREFCRRRDAGEQIADLVKWEPYGHVSRRLLAGTRPGPLA